MERKLKNPFDLFPQEIWEMMLEQMEYSRDILSVLRGLPQLDISIDNKKRIWYIDQILPCLKPSLCLKDVMNLRLVCKEWQYRVDHFLQNQPCYRAYSEDLHKTNPQFFDYLDKWENNNNLQKFSIVVRTDAKAGSISKLDEIMEHPPTRNPFVFREIAVHMQGTNDELEKMHLAKLFRCLEQFGSQVWYLYFMVLSPVCALQINVFIKLLHHSKNLKSLKIILYLRRCGDDDTPLCDANFLEKNLPELPFLETLEISGVYSNQFVRVLVKRYGPQIRRFAMPIHRWNVDEFKNLFAQLTELNLGVCFSFDSNQELSDVRDVSMLRNLLAGISAPHLVQLQVFFENRATIVSLSIEDDILKWLKRFPKIKFFEIKNGYAQAIENPEERLMIKENGTSDPIKDKIHTLQTFKIAGGHGLSYHFLRCFPSLRQLEIRPFSSPTVNVLSDPMQLREQIQTGKLYESNIWEILPKLRETTLQAVFVFDGHTDKLRFYRETFEKLKNAGRISTQFQLHPFREDVQDYFEYFANGESAYCEWAGEYYYDEDDNDSVEPEMEDQEDWDGFEADMEVDEANEEACSDENEDESADSEVDNDEADDENGANSSDSSEDSDDEDED